MYEYNPLITPAVLFGHKSPPKTVDFVFGLVFGVKDAGLGEEIVHVLWVTG